MRSTAFVCLVTLSLPLAASAQNPSTSAAAENLGIAAYTAAGELVFPSGTTEWIHLGSAIGRGYSTEAFTPDDPGTIHIVQIEPTAYRFFLANGRYADGTMLLLSFYQTEPAPQPELNGFTQGALAAREIHVIDRSRFADERGFFLFGANAQSSPMVPAGNECVVCHAEHGAYDSTFTQFYPPLRGLLEAADD